MRYPADPAYEPIARRGAVEAFEGDPDRHAPSGAAPSGTDSPSIRVRSRLVPATSESYEAFDSFLQRDEELSPGPVQPRWHPGPPQLQRPSAGEAGARGLPWESRATAVTNDDGAGPSLSWDPDPPPAAGGVGGRALPWEVELGLVLGESADWGEEWPKPRWQPKPERPKPAPPPLARKPPLSIRQPGARPPPIRPPGPPEARWGAGGAAAAAGAALPRGDDSAEDSSPELPHSPSFVHPSNRVPARPRFHPSPLPATPRAPDTPPAARAWGNDDLPALAARRRSYGDSETMSRFGADGPGGGDDIDGGGEQLFSPHRGSDSVLAVAAASPLGQRLRGALRTPEKRTERLAKLARRARSNAPGAGLGAGMGPAAQLSLVEEGEFDPPQKRPAGRAPSVPSARPARRDSLQPAARPSQNIPPQRQPLVAAAAAAAGPRRAISALPSRSPGAAPPPTGVKAAAAAAVGSPLPPRPAASAGASPSALSAASPGQRGQSAGLRPTVAPPRQVVGVVQSRSPASAGNGAGPRVAASAQPRSGGARAAVQRRPDLSSPAPMANNKKVSKAPLVPLVAAESPAALAARARSAPNRPNKGDEPDDPVTRQMFDKRHSRKQHAGPFMAAIQRWRLRQADAAAAVAAEAQAEDADPLLATGVPERATALFFARKRPLFQHEGDYDCITVGFGGKAMMVHSCQMHADLRRMFVRHLAFGVTHAFGESSTDEQVFQRTAAPLVRLACSGGVAALFMYGQTGSGKTHTMTAIEERAAAMFFGATSSGHAPRAQALRVEFLELVGKRSLDLLSPTKAEVTVKEHGGGESGCSRVDFVGGTAATVHSTQELMEVIGAGKARRATSATLCNAASSRSHAVCRISVEGSRGSLTLVDCAGSERKEDSMYHTKEQREEGAQINASLHALKECVRMRAAKLAAESDAAAAGGLGLGLGGPAPPAIHVHVPYRSSLLTRILAECFVRADAALAVIGTVSPTPTDTEHTVSTLRAISVIGGSSGVPSEAKEDVPAGLQVMESGSVQESKSSRVLAPVHWSAADVQAWLIRSKVPTQAPSGLTGRELVRMTPASITGLLAGGDERAGAALFKALRDEIAKAARVKAKQRGAGGGGHRI